MKKTFTLISTLVLTLIYCASHAQIYWDFGTSAPQLTATTSTFPSYSVSALSAGNFAGGLTPTTNFASAGTYYPASGSYNVGVSASTGGLSFANSTYFQLTLTPVGNTSVVVTSINFGSRSTANGPAAYSIRSSVDNYTTDIANGFLNTNSSWGGINNLDINLTGLNATPVTIRIYGFNGSGTVVANEINWRLDDLIINDANGLPLKLNSFTSAVINNNALLKWTTSQEVNVKGFSVEKSTDGATFHEIAYVTAKNIAGTNTYTITDVLPAVITYYRIKVTDKDGAFIYSKNVVINPAIVKGLSVYPNPVVTGIAVVSHTKAGKKSFIQVVDILGRNMALFLVQNGATQTSIDLSSYAKGMYHFVYINENTRQSIQVNKN